jgi:hypothetical protein
VTANKEVRMPGPLFILMLLVGLATIVAAAHFAFRPAERTLAVVRPLCAATTYASIVSFCAGVVNGLVAITRQFDGAADPAATARIWRMAVSGFAESPVALIVGFGIVTVAWLLVAVGLRRQP